MHEIEARMTDPEARYFGALLQEDSLLPTNAIHLGKIRFSDWLDQASRA